MTKHSRQRELHQQIADLKGIIRAYHIVLLDVIRNAHSITDEEYVSLSASAIVPIELLDVQNQEVSALLYKWWMNFGRQIVNYTKYCPVPGCRCRKPTCGCEGGDYCTDPTCDWPGP